MKLNSTLGLLLLAACNGPRTNETAGDFALSTYEPIIFPVKHEIAVNSEHIFAGARVSRDPILTGEVTATTAETPNISLGIAGTYHNQIGGFSVVDLSGNYVTPLTDNLDLTLRGNALFFDEHPETNNDPLQGNALNLGITLAAKGLPLDLRLGVDQIFGEDVENGHHYALDAAKVLPLTGRFSTVLIGRLGHNDGYAVTLDDITYANMGVGVRTNLGDTQFTMGYFHHTPLGNHSDNLFDETGMFGFNLTLGNKTDP